jgi:hypothetical protein
MGKDKNPRKKSSNKLILLGLILLTVCACGTTEPTNSTNWHCEESSVNGSRTYLVTIYKTIKDTTIQLISNFHNRSIEGEYDVKVKLTGKGYTFNPLPQQVGSSQYIIRSGSGKANANSTQIDFDYTIFDTQKNIELAFHDTYTR